MFLLWITSAILPEDTLCRGAALDASRCSCPNLPSYLTVKGHVSARCFFSDFYLFICFFKDCFSWTAAKPRRSCFFIWDLIWHYYVNIELALLWTDCVLETQYWVFCFTTLFLMRAMQKRQSEQDDQRPNGDPNGWVTGWSDPGHTGCNGMVVQIAVLSITDFHQSKKWQVSDGHLKQPLAKKYWISYCF